MLLSPPRVIRAANPAPRPPAAPELTLGPGAAPAPGSRRWTSWGPWPSLGGASASVAVASRPVAPRVARVPCRVDSSLLSPLDCRRRSPIRPLKRPPVLRSCEVPLCVARAPGALRGMVEESVAVRPWRLVGACVGLVGDCPWAQTGTEVTVTAKSTRKARHGRRRRLWRIGHAPSSLAGMGRSSFICGTRLSFQSPRVVWLFQCVTRRPCGEPILTTAFYIAQGGAGIQDLVGSFWSEAHQKHLHRGLPPMPARQAHRDNAPGSWNADTYAVLGIPVRQPSAKSRVYSRGMM